MRRFLFILLFLPVVAWAEKDTPAKKLVSLLTECKEREDLVPDSFFSDVLLLKQEIKEQKDSAAKAIYSATLAHILMQNAYLGQSRKRETVSHPDSITEWGREEYLQHAISLYNYALRDLELLHNVPTNAWLPLVKRGEDEKLYNSSMLAVVIKAMHRDFRYENRKSYNLLSYATLIQFYENHELREGAFRLCMDSLDWVWKHEEKEKYLLQLKEDYQNQPFCDEVYCKLSELKNKDEEKLQILEEGLKLYPKSNRIKNEIEELKNPLLTCGIPNCMYPGEEIEVEIENGRNMRGVRLITYRLPDDFSEDEDEGRDEELAHVLRVGKQVKKEVFTFAPHSDFETWKDTLRMQAPSDFGYYGMVIEPIHKGRINKDDDEKRKLCRFYVSKLRGIQIWLPNKQRQIVVVDGKSGKPEQGISVKVMPEQNAKTRKSYKEYITDKHGKVTFDVPTSKDEIRVSISKGDDRFSTKAFLTSRWGYSTYERENDEVEQLRTYTDRSIYRPGQTVYIGGVAFKQKGKETSVNAGDEYKFTFSDTKGNKLAERWIKTDEFGVISDSVSLPKDAAPGNYRIRVGITYSSVRVEEYRRPTFSVEMDPAPAVSFPADSIHLTGKAVTYSGVPVVNARVTGKASFYAGFWGWRGDAIEKVLKDTLYTDAEGRFKVGLPLSYIQEDIRYGASITLDVDVLSQQGETEQGNITVRMSSRPYVLNGNVLARQDKDALRTWIFGLYSSTGAKVDGDIVCRILEGKDTEKARMVISANKPVSPDKLKTLPSGVYKVIAEYVNNKDTARYEQKIELFSLSDTRVVGEQDVFMYTPCDTFAIGRPAKVQIGTSLKDVWMFCTILHHDKIVLDTLMCLSDTAFVWEIPYKEEYGDGVLIRAYLYHNKTFYWEDVKLHQALPKKELTKHWETFRDRLRPGQQEEWRLSLRQPDGKPANANVLLSMYDASLDAILKHKIGFELNYMHNIPSLGFAGSWCSYKNLIDFEFLLIGYKVKNSWKFSEFNRDYLLDPSSSKNISLSRSGRFGYPEREYSGALQRFPPLMAKANRGVSAEAVMAAAPDVDGLAFESVDQALNGKIAGLDIKDPELAEGEMRGTKRDAFSELAFFCPTLRTDANGEAKISFTLPESLTSWHLTGFAHDKDLFTTPIDETIVAQKELMAELYLPRFLRSGDEASFTASIRNVSERLQQGKASCVIMDAATEKVLASFPVQFRLDASRDTVYTFPVGSLDNHTALLVKWVAEGTDYSDGEQRQLPILSDLEDVTETRAFFVSGKGTSKFDLESLFAHNHPSATNRNMVVEYTARPAWLALKALPSLFTPHCKCVLCTSAAYYATSMAQHILRQVPDADALVDSLHYDAMISLDYRMSLLSSLSALQRSDGAFVWFPGMGANTYLTFEVAYQLARLRHVGVASDAATVVADRMLKRAMDYLAKDAHKELKDLKDKKDKQITNYGLRYLYILSLTDVVLTAEQKKDQKLLIELLQPSEGREYSIEEAALAAIVLKRNSKDKLAERYLEGLDKKLTHPDGYYISYISGSFTSINRKVQTHVQVMEAFREVKPSEQQLLNGMTEWLLQQKRTQQWDEPVKTVNAVYALLQDDSQPLAKGNSDVLKLREGQKTHTFVTPHTSVGYLRDSLSVSVPKELRVEKHEKGLSWGAVYATYQMPLDSVRASWQGFHIRRDVSSLQPKVGDRLHVRYTITADRDYEFVQLTAPRSAAAEPDASLSGYRYQNGLGYYRQIRDDRTEYYFDRMPKGTYVIEEDWLISRTGNYQMGSTVIKCLYAPEYQSFTASNRLIIQQK